MIDRNTTWGNLPSAPRSHSRSKLTPAQRDEIRRRKDDGESVMALALEFGMSAKYLRTL